MIRTCRQGRLLDDRHCFSCFSKTCASFSARISATETCIRCQAKMFAVMQDADRQREIDQAWSVTVQTGRCGKTARRSFLLFYMMNGGSMTSARPEHLTRADRPDMLCA